MGRSEGDGLFEIVAHAHRQLVKAVAVGQLAQQGEVQRGGLIHRRNTHQAPYRQVERVAFLDEGVGVVRGDPGLLGFFARIHLNEEGRTLAHLLRQPREGLGKLRAVQRVDHVEQLERLTGLVALQRTDQVQVDAVKGFPEIRPLSRGFLDAVLAETAMAFPQDGLDPVVRLHLGHRDEGDVCRVALGLFGGLGDPGGDVGQSHAVSPHASMKG